LLGCLFLFGQLLLDGAVCCCMAHCSCCPPGHNLAPASGPMPPTCRTSLTVCRTTPFLEASFSMSCTTWGPAGGGQQVGASTRWHSQQLLLVLAELPW
jgi:hypothetical protein